LDEVARRVSETTPNVPQRPSLDGLDTKWADRWEQSGVYRFDPPGDRASVFSIDTPPPTVSGSLHVGHVFSYTHTDIIARFHRMCGKRVFYPMGWDDNGLPTERRVQNYFGVRCDPSLPYDRDFTAPEPMVKKGERPVRNISRRNFVELCEQLTVTDEQAFEEVWRRLGLSVDWSMTYTTIGRRAQRVSQRSFLRLLKAGEAYQAEAPTLWDVGFQTAVAQAELEDREHPGAWHRIAFHRGDGGPVLIDTTRPELLPACVALIAHPDDEVPDAVRCHGLLAGVRRAPACGCPPGCRTRARYGPRDVLHLRRHHRRAVVARAQAPYPDDHRPGRPHPARPTVWFGQSSRAQGIRGAGGGDGAHRPGARRGHAARVRRPARRAGQDRAAGEVL
jgi:hypothetical protein